MSTATKTSRAVLTALALTLFGAQLAPAQETELFAGEVTEIVSGLDMPWGLAFLPDGTALVSERQSARILRIDPETGSVQELGVVPDMDFSAEGGLLGLAVSPNFAEDRTVFAYVSSVPTNRVVALTVNERLDSFAFDRVVLDGIGTANRHHGGRLRFGPDGHLWVGTGDAFDPPRSQDQNSLNGKILRINSDGTTPEDNPYGTPVFSIGHRNVQGLDFGPDGTLYASELGGMNGTNSTSLRRVPTMAGRCRRVRTANWAFHPSTLYARRKPHRPALPTRAERYGWARSTASVCGAFRSKTAMHPANRKSTSVRNTAECERSNSRRTARSGLSRPTLTRLPSAERLPEVAMTES